MSFLNEIHETVTKTKKSPERENIYVLDCMLKYGRHCIISLLKQYCNYEGVNSPFIFVLYNISLKLAVIDVT